MGRLLERNTRAARLFDVQVEVDAQGFTQLRWTKVESWQEWARRSEGCYLLRSNVTDWTPEELWRAYVQLTEAEAAFRVHKSDLQIRPVWHHREDRVGAHILVCFLAYVLWKTLAASCRQAGLGNEPRQVFKELPTSLWSMWFCPHATEWRSGNAASASRPNTNGFCCNASA